MLKNLTVVILTFNEERNIARTMEQLRSVPEILVVDSNSSDRTLDIVRSFPQARLVQRTFTTHAEQWNFAVHETGLTSDWVLALDADYFIPEDALDEIRNLDPGGEPDGYQARFRFAVWGRPLRGALYPPVTVLFRRTKGHYLQDGHTQRLKLHGSLRTLTKRFVHDDRKSLSHWISAQDRYMVLEASTIASKPWPDLSLPDKVRCLPPLAPIAVFFSCYFIKLGFLDGRAGLYYALQRTLAETLLALRLIEKQLSFRSE